MQMRWTAVSQRVVFFPCYLWHPEYKWQSETVEQNSGWIPPSKDSRMHAGGRWCRVVFQWVQGHAMLMTQCTGCCSWVVVMYRLQNWSRCHLSRIFTSETRRLCDSLSQSELHNGGHLDRILPRLLRLAYFWVPLHVTSTTSHLMRRRRTN